MRYTPYTKVARVVLEFFVVERRQSDDKENKVRRDSESNYSHVPVAKNYGSFFQCGKLCDELCLDP